MESLGFKPGQLSLLAGCPPCQGFSSMRTLNGKHRAVGRGANMVYQLLRFTRVLKPQTVMLENVPGLANNWRLRVLIRGLHRLKYHVVSRVLDAADYGVPQRRRRLILVGSLLGEPTLAPPRTKRSTVRKTISLLPVPGNSGDPCHDLSERRKARVADLIRRIPKDGGSRADLGAESQLRCHIKSDGFHDVYGRMRWDDVAPTITGGCVNPSKGRFLHPDQDRAITLREAALLQGFPSSYKFALSQGKFRAAEMIGNAFPPGFVAPHARRLRRQIELARDAKRG